MVGREREIMDALTLLRTPEVRLLTLTGPGGVGKTRLALEVAAEFTRDVGDHVWFVPLAEIRDADLVLSNVAHAVGVRETADRPVLDGLAEAFAGHPALLVLDNFEQVTRAAPLVAQLLMHAPQLKLLTTSRSPLGVRAEQAFPLAPLAVPRPGRDDTVAALSEFPAVALFVQRARAIDPAFSLTDHNAAAVAEVCRRLDGLPLAIELAAARTRFLSPQALLARLAGRLALLSGGARDLPARQQTLRDAIAWSYDLLNAAEQRLFRRLAAFSGGRSLASIEALGERLGETELPAIEGLASLVEKSLVRAEEQLDGEPRFGMLRTIDEFGRELLDASDEADAVRGAHAAFFLDLAERAEPELVGPDQGLWFDRLEADHDNLRAALAWATEQNEAETSLRLAGALWRFWAIRGYLSEGRGWLERALSLEPITGAGDGAVLAPRAKALHHLGNMDYDLGDYAQAQARYDASLAIRRELGDRGGVAASLNGLGLVAACTGDYARARALHEEALAIRRSLDDRQGLGNSLSNLGNVAKDERDFKRARALLEEALAVRQAMGDIGAVAYAYLNLGDLARAETRQMDARPLFERSLALFWQVGDKLGIGYALHRLGLVATGPGQGERAARFAESMTLRRELGDRHGVAECMEGLAAVAAAIGNGQDAVRLMAAADALREAIGAPRPPSEEAEHRRRGASARVALGESAFAAASAAGRALSLEQALADALAIATRAASAPAAPIDASPQHTAPVMPGGLSERELGVL